MNDQRVAQGAWKERLYFLFHFLKNPLRNASVIPSSQYAAEAMFTGVDWSKAQTIVELGPGTGTFTQKILRHARQDAHIILFELEKNYVDLLRSKFGHRVEVLHTGAQHMEEIFREKQSTT